MSNGSFRKGDLVRIYTQRCFTAANGGDLEFPLYSHYNDDEGIITGIIPTSKEEQQKQRQVAMDSGRLDPHHGEGYLVDKYRFVNLSKDHYFFVTRARAKLLGTTAAAKDYCTILDPISGEDEVYVLKHHLEKVC